MGYTDLGDSLEDMKIRAEHRHFNFPFLYDGETQEISRKYGPVATPHVFVFDEERKLRYQGRIDSNPREAYAKVPDARNAIDAVLAGTPVAGREDADRRLLGQVARQEALHDAESDADRAASRDRWQTRGLDEMQGTARRTPTGKTRLVNFWATWCAPCTAEFPELQKIWRMYRKRPFELVTVSLNYPDEEKGVRRFLESQHASTRNLLFRSTMTYDDDGGLRPRTGTAACRTRW